MSERDDDAAPAAAKRASPLRPYSHFYRQKILYDFISQAICEHHTNVKIIGGLPA